jgi:UDPglucose 6-dehydrogenase
MKIIIAGYGFVGKAVGTALSTKHRVLIVDPKLTTNKVTDFASAEGIIICVPTPPTINGQCDISIVRSVIAQVPIYIPILIKSTITPDKLNEIVNEFSEHSICYSPEFLTAKNADKDFAAQKFMIIGGDDPEYFWKTLFQGVLNDCSLYFDCSITEASMTKYTANSFLSTKVSFFNQIYSICKENGADFERVRQMVGHDRRIGAGHTLVPGPDGQFGWGGSCFPKDTKAFSKYASDLNKPVTVLDSAMDYNKTVRKDVDL